MWTSISGVPRHRRFWEGGGALKLASGSSGGFRNPTFTKAKAAISAAFDLPNG
jgi:hypothetical protein